MIFEKSSFGKQLFFLTLEEFSFLLMSFPQTKWKDAVCKKVVLDCRMHFLLMSIQTISKIDIFL